MTDTGTQAARAFREWFLREVFHGIWGYADDIDAGDVLDAGSPYGTFRLAWEAGADWQAARATDPRADGDADG